jgi:hypothetical protein
MLKIAIPLVVFLSSLVYASEEVPAADQMVKSALDEAELLFKQRSVSNPRFLDMILDKLTAIENKAESSDLNYQVYVLESKILYWKAKYILGLVDLDRYRLKREDLAIFSLGKAKAEAAIQCAADYAEAHYYAGTHTANIARIVSTTRTASEDFLEIKEAAKKRLEEARRLPIYFEEDIPDKIGDDNFLKKYAGKLFDGWGPYRERAFADLVVDDYFRDHGLYSYPTGLFESKKAYENARNYAENVTIYARTLLHGGRFQRFLAVNILNSMLSQDPHTYNPDRVEETIVEFRNARQILERHSDESFIHYRTAKEGLKDYAEATKLQEEASNRVVSNQTKLNALNAEYLSSLEILKRQEKVFSTFDLLRSQVEEATPILVAKIQAYLASQQDSLQAVLEDLNRLVRETQDPKVRDALQFEILILSDLAAAKRNIGDTPESLKKMMDLAVHGNGEERAKALSYFDPLTQAIIKWVFQVSLPAKGNIFTELKKEITKLQIFAKEHVSMVKSDIELTTQNLQYAKDDLGIAQHVVKQIYDACLKAQGLL